MVGLLQSMNQSIKICLLIVAIAGVHAAVTVNAIAGVSTNNLVFSGLIPISSSDNLFFTYYGVDGETNQDNLQKYPTVVVVGSPGNSAQYYSLSGIGPMNLQSDMTLTANPDRWTAVANVMSIDLLGSGFSFASDSNNLPTKAEDFGKQLALAWNTFAKESVLGKSTKIVLVGEGTFVRSLVGLGDLQGLSGIIHVSAWPDLTSVGKTYGAAGIQLQILITAQKNLVESTMNTCSNSARSSQFLDAHRCLDAVYNFVELSSKNANLFDTRLKSNLTEFLPMIHNYFSQNSVISRWKAPTTKLFETQSAYTFNKTYLDLPKDYNAAMSKYMKDFASTRHWFIQGRYDFISYYKGVRSWLENDLSFPESPAFKKAALQDIVIDGAVVGYAKAVKQVAYSQIINSGHHALHDSPKVLAELFKGWVASLGEPERNISSE